MLLPLMLLLASADRAPLGINLAGIADWSTELVFVDQFRCARGWISQAKGQPWGKGGPLDVDADGHVKSLAAGQFAETILWTDFGKSFPEGRFVCLYDGDGDVEFGGDARAVERARGRVALDVKANGGMASLRLTRTNPADPVRRIRVLHPGHEATYETKPFHASLLERWKGAKAVRFMDWQKTNDSKQTEWADRPTPRMHSQALKGVCVELMAEFCNATKMDAWFCVPHLATDGYVRSFAEAAKKHLDPGLKVYVEYSNECWNGQFAQAKFCAERGRDLSPNRYEGQLRFYSARSVEVFAIFESVFGKGRLVRVLAAQSANPWTGTTVMDWRRAHEHADAIAIAPYFGHRFGAPKAPRLTLDALLDELAKDLAANRKVLDAYSKAAGGRKLALMAYEGGQHLAGHSGAENDEALTKLFHAANRHPRMGELYRADYEQWHAAGGGLFMVFSSVGRYSKWGSWGQLETFSEKTSPKYRAFLEYVK